MIKGLLRRLIFNGTMISTALMLTVTSAWAAETPPKHAGEPEKGLGLYQQALGHFESGRYAEAIPGFEAAIAAYPAEVNFYTALAMAYKSHGQLEQAEKTLNRAMEIDPKRWEIWNALAHLYFAQKDYKMALSCGQHALSLNPPKKEKEMLMKAVEYTETQMQPVSEAAP